MQETKSLRLTRNLHIQIGRTRQLPGWKKWFYWERQLDILSDDIMSASLTLFGVSFVYLGTAA